MDRSVTYSEKEQEIVDSGLEAIEKVLLGTDMEAKERLLFCLDKYMDPWFGYHLPYFSELDLLLQRVIIADNPIYVKEDAIDLLRGYSYPPFKILLENFEQIEDEIKPDVSYLLDMDKEI